MAALLIDVYGLIYMAASTHFADKDALRGTLVDNLKAVRPNKFFGVPRVYEKIQEKLQEAAAQRGAISKTVAAWAKRQGTEYHVNRRKYGDDYRPSLGYRVAKKLIFSQVYGI